MEQLPISDPVHGQTQTRRHYLLVSIGVGSLAFLMALDPFGQPTGYHSFVDQRSLVGIPNALDVLSNLPFLLVGIAGVVFCLRKGAGVAQAAWITLFAGVAFVSAGSAFYHLTPTNETLVWDRLPMTVGFMGLFAALIGEYVNPRLGRVLLLPAVLLGLLSVFYWAWSDDLRLYVWIQVLPLLTIPVLVAKYRPLFSHQWLLLVAFGLYAVAKLVELYDPEVYSLTGNLLSGHSLKHILAALSVYALYRMVAIRQPLGGPPTHEPNNRITE